MLSQLPPDLLRCVDDHCNGMSAVALRCASSYFAGALSRSSLHPRAHFLWRYWNIPFECAFTFWSVVGKGFLDEAQWMWGRRDAAPNAALLAGPTLGVQAATHGRLDMLAWLRSIGCTFGEEAVSAAARNGHVLTIAWLFDHGAVPSSAPFWSAARNGHVDALKALVAHGCHPRAESIEGACCGGHVLAIEYLDGLGVDWHPYATFAAAMQGHLHVLQWSIDHGHPLDLWTLKGSMARGRVAELDWIWARGTFSHHANYEYLTSDATPRAVEWLRGKRLT